MQFENLLYVLTQRWGQQSVLPIRASDQPVGRAISTTIYAVLTLAVLSVQLEPHFFILGAGDAARTPVGK